MSYNNLQNLDPSSLIVYNPGCLTEIQILDLSFNMITELPYNLLQNMSKLRELNLTNNQLTTIELWVLYYVKNTADFSNNQISTITNKFGVQLTTFPAPSGRLDLTNNAPSINLTDAIYEMYDNCIEPQSYINQTIQTSIPLTLALFSINFDTSMRLNCSCDQYYILQVMQLYDLLPIPKFSPLSNFTCTDGALFGNYSCQSMQSSVDFTKVYPRFCKINADELGNVPTYVPLNSTSSYPLYFTRNVSNGHCLFSIKSLTEAIISCTNDTNPIIIPDDIKHYLNNETIIKFLDSSISTLPSDLCTLPPRQIDLSNQLFTVIDRSTFPCLDWFQTISLSNNDISIVNVTNNNFLNLTTLDLSDNQLTMIPYTLLSQSRTSLRNFDLHNNYIDAMDLWLYTFGISIDLTGNPMNNSIKNYQNTPLSRSANRDSNISLSLSTFVINDTVAVKYGTCNDTTFPFFRTVLDALDQSSAMILLSCGCESINLKIEYTHMNYSNITDYFNCTIQEERETFLSLMLNNCPGTNNFTNGLCTNFDDTSLTTMEVTTPTVTMTDIKSIATSITTILVSSTVPMTNHTMGDDTLSRNGLIIGLVLGCVGFLAVIAGIILGLVKTSAASKRFISKLKTSSQVDVVGRQPEQVQTRIQTRNPRSYRLPPLETKTMQLVTVANSQPVTITGSYRPETNANTVNATSRTPSVRGIPVRPTHLEVTRSPTHVIAQYPQNLNLSTNLSSFQPVNNQFRYNQMPQTQTYSSPNAQYSNYSSSDYNNGIPRHPPRMMNIGGSAKYS
ncbi:unnamed protein product [Didymodactylos carnosus]|uniref:Uncharacterized protein n=1 Tax=Didymodactylos carnosus TaxID=1234261 RepID=A0A813W251_9BILA|nr:unnamed protein product [Didymodactylos carnosus]CAF0982940.1 unnamed protein product [Didymodactylos carnosus]CAF3636562.1 unnamed protein product [Didymodactylos carnosus]CAF3753439.1 unnamed protein product [Didymodactylos carnosus]